MIAQSKIQQGGNTSPEQQQGQFQQQTQSRPGSRLDQSMGSVPAQSPLQMTQGSPNPQQAKPPMMGGNYQPQGQQDPGSQRLTPKIYNPQTGEYETYEEIQARHSGKPPSKPPVSGGVLRINQPAPGQPQYEAVPIPQGYRATQGEYTLRGLPPMQSQHSPNQQNPNIQQSPPMPQQAPHPMSGYQQGRHSPTTSVGSRHGRTISPGTPGPSSAPGPQPFSQFDNRSPQGSISDATGRAPTGPGFISIQYEVPKQQQSPGQISQVPSISPDAEIQARVQRDTSQRTPGDPVLPASVRRAGEAQSDSSSLRSPPPPAQSPPPQAPKQSPTTSVSAATSSSTPNTAAVLSQVERPATVSPVPQQTPIVSPTPGSSSSPKLPDDPEVKITPPTSPSVGNKHPVAHSGPPPGANLPIVHPEFADEKIPVFEEPEKEERIVMSATSYPGQAWEPEYYWMGDGELF